MAFKNEAIPHITLSAWRVDHAEEKLAVKKLESINLDPFKAFEIRIIFSCILSVDKQIYARKGNPPLLSFSWKSQEGEQVLAAATA